MVATIPPRKRRSQAATRLFGEKGFRDARTADIAAAAGVTERTLFRYFPSKDSLYRRVLKLRTERRGRLRRSFA